MTEIRQLETELRERRRQLANAERLLLKSQSQGVGAGGPGGGGFWSGEVDRLNRQIREAQGIDVMEARIAELEMLLGLR
ncbi:MAG: hypothetical protein WD990_13465 [Acidimicrobiia bacterium]